MQEDTWMNWLVYGGDMPTLTSGPEVKLPEGYPFEEEL